MGLDSAPVATTSHIEWHPGLTNTCKPTTQETHMRHVAAIKHTTLSAHAGRPYTSHKALRTAFLSNDMQPYSPVGQLQGAERSRDLTQIVLRLGELLLWQILHDQRRPRRHTAFGFFIEVPLRRGCPTHTGCRICRAAIAILQSLFVGVFLTGLTVCCQISVAYMVQGAGRDEGYPRGALQWGSRGSARPWWCMSGGGGS